MHRGKTVELRVVRLVIKGNTEIYEWMQNSVVYIFEIMTYFSVPVSISEQNPNYLM